MTLPKVKVIIFAFLMFLITVFLWWQLSLFLTKGFADLSHLTYIGIGWLLFLAFSLAFLFLVEQRNIVFVTFIFGIESFFLFFVGVEKLTLGMYGIATLVFLLLVIIAYERMLVEKQERVTMVLRKIWKRGLPFLVLGLSLMIAVTYYFNPLLKIGQQEIEIPSEVFRILLKPASGLISGILPFYDENMTIDEILTTGSMLEGGGTSSLSLDQISPELLQSIDIGNLEGLDINELLNNPEIGTLVREQLSQQTQKMPSSVLNQQRKALEQSLGITIKGNETFDILIARVVNDKLKDFVGPRAKELSIGIAVALFFVLRLLGKIFSFLIIIFARMILSFLLLLNIAEKKEVTKQGETIIM
ncbi:hypothetical protein MYX06_02340 [Patescibacteria group bacterium AH-259-L05]|nr:hypothetical protein [Patescibacteria group bacterium AH-259-L05]